MINVYMKWHRGCALAGATVLSALACAAALFALAGTAAAGTITDCSGCHGMPPVDAPYRNISTGRFMGSHDTHAWLSAGTPNCAICHKMPTTYNHRNNNVDFVSTINNSRLTARYRNLTSFTRTASPSFGTCSNVNCHFEKTTPQNGATPLYLDGGKTIQQKCATCHSAPPADARHAKHAQYYGDVTTACVKCHPDHGAKPGKGAFSHATSAGRRGLAIQFTAFPNTGGSFSGDVSYPLYLYNPSRTGACTNLYCHSPGTKAGSYDPPNQSPDWAGTLGTSCLGCHRGDADSGSPMQTGSHGAHVGVNAAAQIGCVQCHGATVTDSRQIGDLTQHVNKKADISFEAAIGSAGTYGGAAGHVAKDVGTAYGTCRNIYCHSDGATTTPPFNDYAVTWGAADFPTGCTGCHGGQQGSGNVIASNNHRKHVDASYNGGLGTGIGCVECHATTVSGNLTIADKARHVNRFKDYSGPRAGTIAAGTCSNVYCHSSGQRSPAYRTMVPWSDTATTYGCSSCHGASTAGPAGVFVSRFGEPNYNNYSSADRNWFNSHNPKHVRSAGDCSTCHAGTTQNGVSLVPGTTLHVNTQKNVTFNTAVAGGNSPSYNDLSRRCTNVYCHSNGQQTGRAYATPRWGGSAQDCNACHPIAGLGGAHGIHVGGMIPTFYAYTGNHPVGAAYRYGCANCHPMDPVHHIDGHIDLSLSRNDVNAGGLKTKNGATNGSGLNSAGSGLTGTTGASVRCASVYCHSNGYAANLVYAATPDWYGGSFAGDRCAACHGNSPNSTIAGSSSHYNNRFLGYTGVVGGHQIGIHAMNIYSSPGKRATAGTTGSSSHGNAATATTISCNICHYETVTTARNDDNAVCKTCHYDGNAVGALSGNRAAIADRSKHVNGLVDVAFKPVAVISKAQMRPASFAIATYSSVWKRNSGYKVSGANDSAKQALDTATMWDGGTKTCSNIACHNGQSVKWTDNNGITECVSCHSAM